MNQPNTDHRSGPDELTSLLNAVSEGDEGAHGRLMNRVYTELHGMARAAWRSVPPSDTLQPTALVHEAYMRLFRSNEPSWENRRHFFAAAARAMHDILVEQARRHATIKRGGRLRRIPFLGDEPADLQTQAEEVLALDEAIQALTKEHPSAARVVMYRVFAELSHNQIAEIERCAEITIRRRWAFAKSWLREFFKIESP